MKKSGLCPHCNILHEFTITGAVRHSGLLCSLGVAVGLKRADAALLGVVVSLAFGDAIEQWIKARCPECSAALQILQTLPI